MGLGHRWPEIARTYADVNRLFGDIVKVTPSSKVVGDLTMFLITRGIKASDVPNLPPGTPFPESVIDMLAGGLGQPMGGWPAEVQKVVLGDRPATTERPGALAPSVDFQEVTERVHQCLGHKPTIHEVYSYLMYPRSSRTTSPFKRLTMTSPSFPRRLSFTDSARVKRSRPTSRRARPSSSSFSIAPSLTRTASAP